MKPIYKRVLLKISGEALAGEQRFGINEEMTRKVAKEVKEIHDLGVQVAIVVGGGNFWRFRTHFWRWALTRRYRPQSK